MPLLSVSGHNKDLQITFDGDVQQLLTLTNDKSPGVLSLYPPIYSSSLKIEVKSAYTQGQNGFAAIRIWTTDSKQILLFIDQFYANITHLFVFGNGPFILKHGMAYTH